MEDSDGNYSFNSGIVIASFWFGILPSVEILGQNDRLKWIFNLGGSRIVVQESKNGIKEIKGRKRKYQQKRTLLK